MVEDKIVIFQKSIYKNKLDETVCQQAHDFILKYKDKFTQRTFNCDVTTSLNLTHNILNIPELRMLKLNILSHIDNFMTQEQDFYDGYIDESWINIYEKKFYQEYHVHSDPVYKKFSGVLYLTKLNSDITFNMKKTITITPKFADILIFEDDIEHRVLPNEEDLRISLAFNFIKKAKWNGIVNGN
jgi:hypothetical protein